MKNSTIFHDTPGGDRAAALALLSANPIPQKQARATEEERTAYQMAAAVLVSFSSPKTLLPASPRQLTANAKDALDEELTIASKAFRGRYMLALYARRQTLRSMNPDDIGRSLNANPHEREGHMQMMYESLLFRQGIRIEMLADEQLEQLLQLLLWLEGVHEPDGQIVAVRRLLEQRRLVAPFEMLAGDGKFYGRVDEMDNLRTHVDVLQPSQLLNRLKRAVSAPFRSSEATVALCLYGPGGIGKSSLVARFTLEHLRLPPRLRIPIAYLDFDRADRDITDPLALVVEIIRQIRVQRSERDDFAHLWEKCQRLLLERADDEGMEQDLGVGHAQALFGDLMRVLLNTKSSFPFVLILDSFEEIQYRGEAMATSFWQVLEEVGGKWSELRIIISGRAPVRSLYIRGELPLELPLGEFDPAAARAFLAAKGIEVEAEANALVRLVGGSPLSLSLGAALLKKSPPSDDALDGITGKRWLLSSATDEVIQGQLYDRILGHIHDLRVRALAHPGLVLRRITPEAILHVLNRPCGLDIENIDDARILFEELQRESSLVSFDDIDGALVHRSDLRRSMLRLIALKEPRKVAQIHRQAATFYKQQRGLRAMAESTYHRLHLNQVIRERWFANPEVRASLQASISDFDPSVQLQLLSFGFEIDPQIEESASRDQKVDALLVWIERMLPYSNREIRSMDKELMDRLKHYRAPVALCVSASRLALKTGDEMGRASWLERAESYVKISGTSLATVEFWSEKCWDFFRRGANDGTVSEALVQLHVHARRLRVPWAAAQYELQQVALVRRRRNFAGKIGDVALKAVARLDVQSIWSLIPLFDMLDGTLTRENVGPWALILRKISDVESPFSRAHFDDSRAQGMLARLISHSREMLYRVDGDLGHFSEAEISNFFVAFQDLVDLWPYALLRVQPPYGYHTQNLREDLK